MVVEPLVAGDELRDGMEADHGNLVVGGRPEGGNQKLQKNKKCQVFHLFQKFLQKLYTFKDSQKPLFNYVPFRHLKIMYTQVICLNL